MFKKIVSGLVAVSLVLGAVGLPAVEGGFDFDGAIGASAEETETVKAQINFASGSWLAQDWNTSIEVKNGENTLTVPAPVDDDGNILSEKGVIVFRVQLLDCVEEQPNLSAELTSITLDGEDYAFDSSKILYGAFDDNDDYFIEIYNDYGDTKYDPGVDKDAFTFSDEMVIKFNVSGIGDKTSSGGDGDTGSSSKYGNYNGLHYVELSDGTMEIDSYDGDDTEVVIPSTINGKTVTTIAEDSFWNCNTVTSITIPDTVTSIGDYVFQYQYLNSLKSINVDKNNKYYTSVDGVLFNKDKTTLIAYPTLKSGTTYTIPNSVTKIEDAAFDTAQNLKTVTIPNSVLEIGVGAFFNCYNLTSLTIPNSVTVIGSDSFSDCENLKSVKIPGSVQFIESNAFNYDLNLESVTIEEGVWTIAEGAFYQCPKLKSVTIPNSVTYIGEMAFGYDHADYSADPVKYYKVDGFKIKCYKGSAAEEYAKANSLSYEAFHEHDYTTIEITKEATCGTDGLLTYICSCGESYTATSPATGKHTLVTVSGVEATCNKAGKTEKIYCSVCKKVIAEAQTVPATGKHTVVVDKAVAATYTSTGKTEGSHCSVCNKVLTAQKTVAKLTKTSISKAKASIAKSSYAYTGKAIKPTVTVKYGSTKLKKGTDYTVSYKNNVKTGKATITIKGKGKYTGTVTKTFNIVPKKATLSSVKSTKTKTVKVTWKKDSQATGYQIVYSTNSKFKSAKTVNVTKNSTTSKTISKLTKGKTYYVKVRSYKTVNGKKVYGAYSTVKKVKCK